MRKMQHLQLSQREQREKTRDTFRMIPLPQRYRPQNTSGKSELRTLATCGGVLTASGKNEPSGLPDKFQILIWVVPQLYTRGHLRFIHFKLLKKKIN